MSKDDSPNGLVVKTPPGQGFLGGGVSRKLIAVIGLSLFAVMMLILYIISQKGHHDAKAAEDLPVTEQGGGQDNGGLNDILSEAPGGGTVSAPQTTPPADSGNRKVPPGTTPAPDARTGEPADEGESEEAKRARIARAQEAEQLRQRRSQLFQTALTAKSGVNINLNDEQDAAKGNATGTTSALADMEQKQKALIAAQGSGGAGPAAGDPNKQGVKMAFAQESHSNTYLTQGREAPLSPYELKVGTLIPATMVSGLNSDLPGQIIASVSQNVWDSATGSHLLIPQGSELYGTYDSQVAYGQDRLLVAWTRVNYPDGTTLELKGMGAIDGGGYAGFADQVDHHYWKIFGNAFVLGMITGATEAGISDDDSNDTSTAESVNNGVTEQFAETGSTLIEKNLDVQPTIIIRNGYRFNIMLSKDVVLEPYQPLQ